MKRYFALLVLTASLAFSADSQPPPPAPTEASQAKQNQATTPKQESNANKQQSGAPEPAIQKAVPAPAAGQQKQTGNNESHESAPKWWELANAISTVVVALVTVLLGVLGYFQFQIANASTQAAITSANAAEKALQADMAMRTHSSIYTIADRFEEEAHEWAKRPFRINDPQVVYHNTVIDRLSPYMNYLEHSHPELRNKTRDAWRDFHGGDEGRVIAYVQYEVHDNEERNKDYWARRLFWIADLLREGGQPSGKQSQRQDRAL